MIEESIEASERIVSYIEEEFGTVDLFLKSSILSVVQIAIKESIVKYADSITEKFEMENG